MKSVTTPWEDATMLDAAIDVACRVRDDNPLDLRDTLVKVPHGALAELALTLAAMVDADAPLNAVRRWTREGFAGWREREVATCKRGHPLVGANALGNGRTADGRQRWRCAECTRNQQSRARRAA